MMVRNGVLEKPVDALGVGRLAGRRAGQPGLQRRPAGKSVLARERVLHVAQRRRMRQVGDGSLEASAGFIDVRAKRFQPPLRFLLETVERAPGGELLAHGNLPPWNAPEVR